MRLYLPSCHFSKQERIVGLLKNIENFVDSKAFINLVELFDGKINGNSLADKLKSLSEFVSVWDYRKKLASNNQINERWNIADDEFVKKNAMVIIECSRALCLVNGSLPTERPNYILPLGGARCSNLDRPLYAKKIIDQFGYSGIKVVALSGFRKINEKERCSVDEYALGAETEFDAINCGLERAFGLKNDYREQTCDNENLHLRSCVRKYFKTYNECDIYSVSAPSTSAERRANSRDTFEFFVNQFKIGEGEKLLLVTSQIYVPYQLLKFADLAIEGCFDVECVGYTMDVNAKRSHPSNYLQEIKGTINTMCELYRKYGGEND